MKPKTKLQHEVIAHSQQLCKIDNDILSWVKKDILEHKGFATKTRVICMDCGGSFSPMNVKRKYAICPHCNTKIRIEQTRKRKDHQHVFVAFSEVVGEFQVIRNFEIDSYHKENKSTRYFIWEIMQHWILPDGKREVVARTHNMGCSSWCGDMEIRQKIVGSYYYQASNDIYPYKFHPHSKFKPEYRKYGIDHRLMGLSFLEAMRVIPNNPKAETLIKAGQYSLLGYCYDYRDKVDRYWPSIKICLRNRYKVKDSKMWFDYLELLSYFKKDLHNAHYVCPMNLNKEHDKYMKRKRRIIDFEDMKRDYIRILKHYGEYKEAGFSYPKNLKREYQILVERQKRDKIEKERKDLEEMELKYQKFIQPFLDIQISDSLIHIVPLQSIEDFKIEGDTLHHCVYTNRYFKREDCLILSARTNESILETIEIDIKNMKIAQCRGERNGLSKHHDRILKLMNRNLGLIKERLKPKKNGTKKDVNRIPQAVDIAV